MLGQSHPSHARFLLASLLWHQMLRGKKKDQGRTDDWEALEGIWRPMMGVAGGLLGTGPQERKPLVDGPLTPHHVGAPSLVFWHASGRKLPWGHLLGFQSMGSPQI